MLLPQTPPFRKRPGKSLRSPKRPPAPPAPPTLVAASCDGTPALTLVFDRPVDVSAIDVALIRVDYAAPFGFTYVAAGAPALLDPVTVQLTLAGVEEYAGEETLLTAAAGNGIVAAEGGLPWAGVSEVELPLG